MLKLEVFAIDEIDKNSENLTIKCPSIKLIITPSDTIDKINDDFVLKLI